MKGKTTVVGALSVGLVLSTVLFQNFTAKYSKLTAPNRLDAIFARVENPKDKNGNPLDHSPWSYSSFFTSVMNSYEISRDPIYLDKLLEFGEKMTLKTASATKGVDHFVEVDPIRLLPNAKNPYIPPKVIMFKPAGPDKDPPEKKELARLHCKPGGYLVHHGVVWQHLVKAATLVVKRNNGRLTSQQTRQIQKIISTSMLGLNYFNKDIKNGVYVFPSYYSDYECPYLDVPLEGLPVPLNFAAAAGLLAGNLKEFFQLSPEVIESAVGINYRNSSQKYIERQIENLRYASQSVLPEIKWDRVTQKTTWNYMAGGRPDDTSHAALVIQYLIYLHYARDENNAQLINRAKIDGLVRTFISTYNGAPEKTFSHIKVFKTKNNPDIRSQGEQTFVLGLARWAPLAKYDCRVYTALKNIQASERKDEDDNYLYRSSLNLQLLDMYSRYCD